MNVVVLSGRLTKDPEVRYTTSQMPVCTFTLAVDRPFSRDRQSNAPTADFIRITVFGKQAENCSRYLQKGRQATISGRIQTGSYQNRDGQTVYTTDVLASRVEFGARPANDRSDRTVNDTGSGTADAPAYSTAPAPAQYQQQSFSQADYYGDIPAGYEMIDEDEVPF